MSLPDDRILGPLTTEFTPAPSCFINKIGPGYGLYPNEFLVSYGVGCGTDHSSFYTDCFPPITLTDGVGYPSDNYDDRVFSPGLFCPQGWSSGCSWTKTAQTIETGRELGDKKMLANMKVGEIRVACCPSGYVCDATFGTSCRIYGSSREAVTGTMFNTDCDSHVTVTTHISFQGPKLYGKMEPIHLLRTLGETSSTTDTTASTTGATASETDTTVSTTDNPTINTATITTTPDGENDGNSSGGALSTGAKVGIGVAVPLVALLAGAIFVFFLLRFRKGKCAALAVEQDAKEDGGPGSAINHSYELPGAPDVVKPQDSFSKRPEADRSAQALYELPAISFEGESKPADTIDRSSH